jgi:hypothetical protein
MNWLLALALLQAPAGPSVALPDLYAFHVDTHIASVATVSKTPGSTPSTTNYSLQLPAGWQCQPMTGPSSVAVACALYSGTLATPPQSAVYAPALPSGNIGCTSYTNYADGSGLPTAFVIICADVTAPIVPAKVK